MIDTAKIQAKTDTDLLSELDTLQTMKDECIDQLPIVYQSLLNIERNIVIELKKRDSFH